MLVLPEHNRCAICHDYRKTLNSMLSRQRQRTDECTSADSCTNYRYLSTPEKVKRMKKLHEQSRLQSQRISRLKTKIDRAVEERGIAVDDALHNDLCATLRENEAVMKENYPPGSFPRIFWEQQQRSSELKNSKSMKWEPAM